MRTELHGVFEERFGLPLVEALGFSREHYHAADGLSVIRCTIMDPFLVERRGRTDLIERFADVLAAELDTAIADVAG